MPLAPGTIDNLLRLAALRLGADERQRLAADLDRIIDMVDALAEVDTTGVAPLSHPLDDDQRLRDDAITEAVDRERYQEAAPRVQGGLYLVPRVVE